ncbi:T-cell surface glycoprotein CD8 alpha chain-like [Podargus strigoides]
MARCPALLLLLALGLCCPGIQGQMKVKFRDSSITHPRKGQRLELECESINKDSSVFWVRLDKGGTLHFIVFISYLPRTTFERNERTSRRFEAGKDGKFYRLVVKSFSQQDEGNYFCIVIRNQVLHFSPGQPAFFPGQQHLHPTSLTSAKMSSSPFFNQSQKSYESQETRKEKELNFFCDIFIWVPLAGACLLLLIALAVTVMLCQRTRRRRCRCKRPANGKPKVKPSMPSRQV